MFLSLLSLLLLFFAALVVVLNWGYVVASVRFKRSGIRRHISTVPLVAQSFVVASAVAQSKVSNQWLLPPWAFWAVALSDISLWSILYFPVFVLRRKFRGPA